MAERNRKTEQAKPSSYAPSAREAAAIVKLKKATDEQAPRLKVSKQGNISHVGPDHPDGSIGLVLLMEALGTTDTDFFNGFLKQLIDTTSQGGKLDEERVNFMLSVIKGIQPRDNVEAMLAAQMAAVHMSTMTFARRLANVENIPQQDSAERAFNKLARTFAGQMEALKRYRTGGEQKVTVQHVTVGEGGQAIVGNVTQNPREATSEGAPAKPSALAPPTEQPMEILTETSPHPMRVRRKSRK
jgi:hypothetical protein